MDSRKLYNRHGHVVVSVPIPPFENRPDVVIWGDRVFRWYGGEYYEVFAYVVPGIG